jgi:hypothetical protein
MDEVIRYLESRTIRSNRNVADSIPVERSVQGGLPTELKWASSTEALYDAMLAIMGYASEDAEVAFTGCSTTVSSRTITQASGNFAATIKVNDVVKIGYDAGGMDPLDEGWGVVTVVTALSLTVRRTSTFVSANTGLVQVKRGARMDNGSTQRSFSLEVARLDLSKFAIFRNVVFNTADISISPGSITPLNLGVIGASTARSGSAYGTAYSTPTNRPSMTSVDVPLLFIGSTEYDVQSLNLQINNNCSPRTRVGSQTLSTIRRGKFRVSGSVSWYYDGYTEIDYYAANTIRSLAIVQPETGLGGAAWSYSIPSFKWTSIQSPTQGPDTDDFNQGQFIGVEDSSGITLRVQRFTVN